MRCPCYFPPSLRFRRTFQGCFQLVPCKPIDPRSFDVAWWVKGVRIFTYLFGSFLTRSPGFVFRVLEDISSKRNNPSDGQRDKSSKLAVSLTSFPHWCVNHTFFLPLFPVRHFFFVNWQPAGLYLQHYWVHGTKSGVARGWRSFEAPPSCWGVRNWVMEITTPLPSRKQTSKIRVMVVETQHFPMIHQLQEKKNLYGSPMETPSFWRLVIWSTKFPQFLRFDPGSKISKRTLLDLILALWVERPASYPVVIPW